MASLVGFGLLVPVLLLGVLVLTIAAVAGGRNEPDPDGERPYALYLAAIAFLSIFIALGAFGAAAGTAVDWASGNNDVSVVGARIGGSVGGTLSESGGSFGSDDSPTFAPEPILPSTDDRDNERTSSLVLAGLVLLAAGALFVWHDGRLGEFRLARGGPGWRTAQASGYLICFLALLAAFGTVIVAAYGIFEVIAPGVARADRGDAAVRLVTSTLVGVAAAGIFAFHWRRLERRGEGRSRLAETVAPLPPPPVPPPPPEPPPLVPVRRERPLRGTEPRA